jgi:hypothetical protein
MLTEIKLPHLGDGVDEGDVLEVLVKEGDVIAKDQGIIELETGMGIVPVELERDESGALSFGRMVQPIPSVQPYPEPDALLAALGATESELPIERYDNGRSSPSSHSRRAMPWRRSSPTTTH